MSSSISVLEKLLKLGSRQLLVYRKSNCQGTLYLSYNVNKMMSKSKWQRRRISFLEGFSYDRQATIVTEVGNIDQESFWHFTILWWQKHKTV